MKSYWIETHSESGRSLLSYTFEQVLVMMAEWMKLGVSFQLEDEGITLKTNDEFITIYLESANDCDSRQRLGFVKLRLFADIFTRQIGHSRNPSEPFSLLFARMTAFAALAGILETEIPSHFSKEEMIAAIVLMHESGFTFAEVIEVPKAA